MLTGSIASSVNGNALGTYNFTGSITVKGTVTGEVATGIYSDDTAAVIVDGGTVTGYPAILAAGDSTVVVNSGTVTTLTAANAIDLYDNAKLAVLGGAVTALSNSYGVVWANGTSTVYVAGGTIADGGIWNRGTATGYYAAGLQAKFRQDGSPTFTSGTNLTQGAPNPAWW